jgi:hypothetical protein
VRIHNNLGRRCLAENFAQGDGGNTTPEGS